MNSIDIDIYMSNLINFFEKNPNDLIVLIGELQKDEFYNRLRDICEKNLKDGKDITISKEQMINVILDLKIPEIKKQKDNYINKIIQKTKFGDIILN